MTVERRQSLLAGALIAMLAIAAGWSVQWALEQRTAARFAAEDLAASERLAEEIEQFRAGPTVATTREMEEHGLGRMVLQARGRAEFAPDTRISVSRHRPQRLGQSPYLQKPATLTVGSVTLQQFAMFLYHLTEDSELTVRDLRLRDGARRDDGLWDAEATVTYLIYSPAAGASGGS